MGASSNLPLQLTSFIGRAREIAEVKRLLESARLLTLTGAGGSGKTRLAIQIAEEMRADFSDGAWFVDLAPLSNPELVAQIVATVFGLQEQGSRLIADALRDYLREKQLLLLLDNCEHLIDACAHFADDILRNAPHVTILATSREALSIAGETTFRAPSLSLPDLKNLSPLDSVAQCDAVRLFVARATAAHPAFALIDQNASTIAHICLRLDGMPLAIELAAARVKALGVDEIAARLDDRFRLLTSAGRKVVPRQQTLRATMDWSYDLLSEQERVLLRRLSVFAGGWTLQAAEAICPNGHLDSHAILDVQSQLIDKSLVVVDEPSGHARYRFLETVRQYAREKLDASGETESVRNRHLDFFLALVEDADSKPGTVKQMIWKNTVSKEFDNIRIAVTQPSQAKSIHDKQIRLICDLRWFWREYGNAKEGRAWAERALALVDATQHTYAYGTTLLTAGVAAFLQQDNTVAQTRFEQSSAILAELGTIGKTNHTEALSMLGLLAMSRQDMQSARGYYERVLVLSRELQNYFYNAQALNGLASILVAEGDLETARTYLDEAHGLAKAADDNRLANMVLRQMQKLAFRQGDDDAARTCVRQIFENCLESGEQWSVITSLLSLVIIETRRGKPETFAQVARFAGAHQALMEFTGLEPAYPQARANFEWAISEIRTQLGKAKFKQEWDAGHALTLEQAIAEALQVTAQPTTPTAIKLPQYPAGLTQREVEVLRLLAMGLSNQEIAKQLVLSKRTVHTHLRSIFSKLDVTTRTAATRVAIEHKIV